MRNITYIANMRIPSERAHSVQIMKMCEAFAKNGNNITLLVPSRKTDVAGDPMQYYSVQHAFPIKKIWSLDLFVYAWIPRKICYHIHTISFSLSLIWNRNMWKNTHIFSRDPFSSWVLSYLHKDVTYEIHDLPSMSWFNKNLCQRVNTLITTNLWKKEQLVTYFNTDPQKIAIAHHGVEFEKFQSTISQQEARQELGLSQEQTYILYTGHLYAWKGVYTLLDATKYISNTHLLIVGGTDEDQAKVHEYIKQNQLQNITLIPFQKHEKMPIYTTSADALVIPTSAQYNIGKHESSPLKLFEYLATGKPIVASDVPAIREIVSENEVFFFEPDNPEDLARTIQNTLANPKMKQNSAHERVKNQSWDERAKKIHDHIDTCNR